MSIIKQEIAAEKFAKDWAGKGYEKGQSQSFWLSLLNKVYGIEEPEKYITFEEQVLLDHTSFIDGYILSTKVLIEQKSIDKNLNAPIRQSDGSYLTPFEQAKRYVTELPTSKHPRWIVISNFAEFHIYDMEHPEKKEPEVVLLKNLGKEFPRLQFLVDAKNTAVGKEMEVSFQAGELVGKLYDEFLKEYKDATNPETLKSLNKLCVRLVFCLYAEDAGVFPIRNQFFNYLNTFSTGEMRNALLRLFAVLNQKENERDPYLEKNLADFPYVNGGLFADDTIEVPQFTESIRALLLKHASEDFDWSEISPTIFGALFESTLNQETRRSNGMHYTSIENIHKVIDPLFLDGLWNEFKRICDTYSNTKSRNEQLEVFHDKLSKLRFMDPACGSGNFLTETYLSLRRLENEIIKLTSKGQMLFDVDGVIRVSIKQFYGIEYNDFAVNVAKTALWIAEFQMMKETEKIVSVNFNFLPLKTYTNIVEGNALRISWEDVVPKNELTYIMGNPPFLGYSLQSEEQKTDMLSVYVDAAGKPLHGAGKIDYVSAWYYKAAQYMQGTTIRTAFVSTNSITQGEQVSNVWKPLYEMFGISIIFCYQTFKWGNEAKDTAAVHCVIVGFAADNASSVLRVIYDKDGVKHFAKNISPYLVDMPTVFVEARSKPLCDVPLMSAGGKPSDGGFLILSEDEYADLVKREPQAEKYIKKFSMGNEFINKIPRYCLWLVTCPPNELRDMPLVKERVAGVKMFREQSKKEATRKKAATPMLFDEVKMRDGNYIAVPKVSSENREYIPMGFLSSDTVAGDKLFVVQNATLYHFGILTSKVHMAWTRAVCGRMKSDYSYSNTVVYNNFPFPNPTPEQKSAIEEAAQNVLDARSLYPESSLADLYDPLTMPPEIRKAHEALDKAVEKAYGQKFSDESEIVAYLMKEYQRLVREEEKKGKKK